MDSPSLLNLTLIAQNGGGGNFTQYLFPISVIMVIFWFMFMRPQNKARRERDLALKELKKNDRVVTIGGIHGVVVSVQAEGKEVVMRVDENTGAKLKMSRAAIHEILRDDESKADAS